MASFLHENGESLRTYTEIMIALEAKLEWAHQHILNLDKTWKSFVDSGSYPRESEDDFQTGNRTFKMGVIAPIPPNIPLITGDAIHNLRSCLDHLTYHLVSVCTAHKGPFDNLYFPIGKDLTDFEGRLTRASDRKTKPVGVVRRLRDDAIKAIRAIEPYRGGRGEIFWNLHTLDVIDKHRFVPTVGACIERQTMSPSKIAGIRYLHPDVMSEIDEVHDPYLFMEQSDKVHFPLESGYILGTFSKPQVHENMQFPVEVAFAEPEILKGKLVIDTLHCMLQAIREIVREFSSGGLFE